MALRDLIPWRKPEHAPVKRDHSFNEMRREMDRLFDDFFRGSGFGLQPFGDWPTKEFAPQVEVTEDDKVVRVSAELPGVTEKDIEITLADRALVLKGEKKEEREDRGKHAYHCERSYGMFRRVIPLPTEVDEDKVEATFKNGVLQISLPKAATAEEGRKRIAVKTG